jgi:hypothetical protein
MEQAVLDAVLLAAGVFIFWAGHCSGVQKGYTIRFMEVYKAS